MRFNLACTLQTDPLVGQFVRQSVKQIFELITEVVLVEDVSEPNILCHSVRVICAAKWWTACAQLVHDNAEGPPVRLHVVALLSDHLGRHVLGRPADGHRLEKLPLSFVGNRRWFL